MDEQEPELDPEDKVHVRIQALDYAVSLLREDYVGIDNYLTEAQRMYHFLLTGTILDLPDRLFPGEEDDEDTQGEDAGD